MKIVTPKPFTFKGGDKAVLLLHGFTGNTADVRMLGRYLNERGYTCHAPQYKGTAFRRKSWYIRGLKIGGKTSWTVMNIYGLKAMKTLRPADCRLAGFFIEIGLHCTHKGNCSYVCADAH